MRLKNFTLKNLAARCNVREITLKYCVLSVEDEVSDIKQQKTVEASTTNSNHDNSSKFDNDLHDDTRMECKGIES